MAVRTVKKEVRSNNEVSNLLLSAAAGGVLGAAAALLLAPKAGAQLRQDILDTYSDVSDKTQDLVDVASRYVSQPKRSSNGRLLLLIGAIGGGLLGASAGRLLSNNEKLEPSFTRRMTQAGKSFAENSVDWIDTAKDVLNTLSQTIHQDGQQAEEADEEEEKNPLREVINWANLGFQVWQNLSKRRR